MACLFAIGGFCEYIDSGADFLPVLIGGLTNERSNVGLRCGISEQGGVVGPRCRPLGTGRDTPTAFGLPRTVGVSIRCAEIA